MPSHEKNLESVGLPLRFFLYTLDQIAMMIGMSQTALEAKYIYYGGRSIGRPSPDLIQARNIAPRDEEPDWRVVDREVVRWMRRKGFKVYDTARIPN